MAEVKPIIKFDVLASVDIRVGTIVKLTDVAESKKLVLLTVDFGDFNRQVVVGLKNERQNPAEIEGKQALFVVNLLPRTIHGQRSEAMLFDIGHADGIVPVLAQPERPVPNGARAG